MNTLKSFVLTCAALAFATGSAIASPAPNAKLWSGTWKLNTAKSKFSAPDVMEKSETRTYTVSGNRVTMHSTYVGNSGKSVKWSYSAVWGGKPYAVVGNRNADHIILTPVSDREVKSRTTLRGKASATATATISEDGNRLTVTRSILTAKGGPSDDILVYERVK